MADNIKNVGYVPGLHLLPNADCDKPSGTKMD